MRAETRLHSRTPGVECLAEQLEKPLLDNRTYRVIKLPNALEALLIHDADTDKASASMDVAVGSFCDPEDMNGMAHAVEHLLFMGTEKFPGENEYTAYLTKYGGYSNAFTTGIDTNFYFELSASSTSNSPASSANSSKASLPIPKDKAPLYGALQIFSTFFICPIFDEKTLDRELQAVDSENKKNLQSDAWRLQQLSRTLSNKEHPLHKFSTGNYKILHDDPIARGVNIRKAFIDFYKEHYSANRMKLAVIGKESLDELQGWVEELFSDVPNHNLPQLRWDDIPPLTEEHLQTEIFVKPVMDQRSLDIFFPYPDEDDLWQSTPGRYISHLIGHEGPGSIFAYLKAKGWANSLSSGPQGMNPGTAFFTIMMRLTEAGLQNYREIIKIIFQYIALISETEPQEWIAQEMSGLADAEFKFLQKQSASRTTMDLSATMQKPMPRDQLLAGPYVVRRFNPEGIKAGLRALTPDNIRATIVSQQYPGDWDQKEYYYGTNYKYEKMPKDFLDDLYAAYNGPASERPKELHFPAPNEFVPQRFDVEKREVAQPAIAPTLIRNDQNVRTWFKKDDQFWVPKANVNLCLRSPLVNTTPFHSLMTSLYKELVEDSLTEYSYDADLAGLEYGITHHNVGLDIDISGYNDKMSVLFEKVLVSMRDLEVKDDRFEVIKERIERGLRNFEFGEPFKQIQTYSRWLINERGWTTFQLLEELPAVTAQDVREYFPQILKQTHIELLVHGNLYKEDALKMANLVENTLKPKRLPEWQWPTRRSIELPPGSNYRYERVLPNKSNVNHCIEYLLCIGSNLDRVLRVKVLLLAQMMDEPLFDVLRTKEQLGYIVGSTAVTMHTALAWRAMVQSEKDGAFLEKRVDAFLYEYEKTIEEMSEEDFEGHKIALINKRLEKLKNLGQETGRFWSHITGEVFDFGLVYKDVQNIEPLTKSTILDFYRKHFLPSSSTRAKASIWLIAQSSAADVAANTSDAEKKEKLLETVSQILDQLGLDVDEAALEQQFESVDIAGADLEGIVGAVGKYLTDVAGASEEEAQEVVEQGRTVIGGVLPSLGIVAPVAAEQQVVGNGHANGEVNGEVQVDREGEQSKAVVIEDVKAWKASMPLSAGPRPVRELSEFEEVGPKL